MNPSQIEHLSPKDLTIHPLFKQMGLPGPSEKSDEFQNLVADIKKHGVLEPLKITPSHEVVDGRHRFLAAEKSGCESIPCIEFPEDQASHLIIASLCQRRHFPRGLLAYLILPLLEAEIEVSRERRLTNLKQGETPRKSNAGLSGRTAEQIAEENNICRTTFLQARQVRQHFAEHPEDREEWETQLLAETYTIFTILPTIAGSRQRGKKREDASSADLILDTVKSLKARFARWPKIPEGDRRAVAREFAAEVVPVLPEEVRHAMVRAIEQEKETR